MTPTNLILRFFFISAFLVMSTVQAIVIRHDRNDARYIEFAKNFNMVVPVGGALGTVISPRWIATAAHVADTLNPISGYFTINDKKYYIERIIYDPSWTGNLPPGLAQQEWVDLALIQVTQPFENIEPAILNDVPLKTNTTIVFVGNGKRGNGLTGPTERDFIMRAATNTVSRVDKNSLYFEFSAPPSGTDLEGISGPGDSGGPALWKAHDKWYLAGVGSRNIYIERNLEECLYGTGEVYSRISSKVEWIRNTLNAHGKNGSARLIENDKWPDTLVGHVSQQFFTAYNSGDKQKLIEFELEWRVDSKLQLSSPTDRGLRWFDQFQRTGIVKPIYIYEMNSSRLIIVAASANHWRTYKFQLSNDLPPKLLSMKVSRINRIHGRKLEIPYPKLPTKEDS